MLRAPDGVTGEFSNEGMMPDAWRAYGWPGQTPLICARMQPVGANPNPSSASPKATSWVGSGGTGAFEANSHAKMGFMSAGVDGEVAIKGVDAGADDHNSPETFNAHGMVLELIYNLAD